MTMAIRRFAPVYSFAQGPAGGELSALDGAEWADWDQRGRLAFVSGGKLLVDRLGGHDQGPRELADFNGQEPAAVPSPEWARRW